MLYYGGFEDQRGNVWREGCNSRKKGNTNLERITEGYQILVESRLKSILKKVLIFILN
jgi:hypothetical protein